VRIGRLNIGVKFRFEIPSDCREKCKKNLSGILFASPCRVTYIKFYIKYIIKNKIIIKLILLIIVLANEHERSLVSKRVW